MSNPRSDGENKKSVIEQILDKEGYRHCKLHDLRLPLDILPTPEELEGVDLTPEKLQEMIAEKLKKRVEKENKR